MCLIPCREGGNVDPTGGETDSFSLDEANICEQKYGRLLSLSLSFVSTAAASSLSSGDSPIPYYCSFKHVLR